MLAYLDAENAYTDAVLAPLEAAAGNAVRRDRRRASSRTTASVPVPRARLLVLHALRDRQGIPHLRAPQGHADGRARARSCSTSTRWPKARTTSGRRLRGQPGQPAAGLGRRRRRPPPVHHPHQGHRHRRAASRRPSPASRPTWSGPTTTAPCSTSRTTRTPCSHVRVKAHVLGTPTTSDALVYEEKDDSFYMGIGRTRDDELHLHRRRTAPSRPRCAARRPPIPASSPCSRRASAMSNTRPTISTVAG